MHYCNYFLKNREFQYKKWVQNLTKKHRNTKRTQMSKWILNVIFIYLCYKFWWTFLDFEFILEFILKFIEIWYWEKKKKKKNHHPINGRVVSIHVVKSEKRKSKWNGTHHFNGIDEHVPVYNVSILTILAEQCEMDKKCYKKFHFNKWKEKIEKNIGQSLVLLLTSNFHSMCREFFPSCYCKNILTPLSLSISMDTQTTMELDRKSDEEIERQK